MTAEYMRDFDHGVLVRLPEYQDLRRAIDQLAKRLDAGHAELKPDDWITAVADMANTSFAADCCQGCHELTWPHAGRVEGTWLTGRYFCPSCSRTWTCGYSFNIRMMEF